MLVSLLTAGRLVNVERLSYYEGPPASGIKKQYGSYNFLTLRSYECWAIFKFWKLK